MKFPHRARPRVPRRALLVFSILALAAAALAPSAQARVEGIEARASSPADLTSVAADPTSGLIYAQENQGQKFFVYDPATNVWSELAEAPIDSGNNGGATYLDGRIYTAYTRNSELLGVYDIATDSWTTIENPLQEGTGDITSGDGLVYLAINQEFFSYDPANRVVTELAEPPVMQEECHEGFENFGGLQFTGTRIYGHQGDGCEGAAVYDVAADSWTELPLTPPADGEEEGPVLGSAYNPVTDTYFAYGTYGGKTLYRFDTDAGTWSTATLPFTVDDGGMAYIDSSPQTEGVYMIEGEDGTGFYRYTEAFDADLATTMTASSTSSADGGTITYSIGVKNDGPDKATGAALTDSLPSGTSLVSATSPQGSCTGTTVVTCDFGTLSAGSEAKATIEVKAGFGTFDNKATATTLSRDPNPANSSASTTTTFTKAVTLTPPAPRCVVPGVRGLTLKSAKAKLAASGCGVGKLTRHRGDKIASGSVIKGGNAPGKNIAPGHKINLIVSIGKKPRS